MAVLEAGLERVLVEGIEQRVALLAVKTFDALDPVRVDVHGRRPVSGCGRTSEQEIDFDQDGPGYDDLSPQSRE